MVLSRYHYISDAHSTVWLKKKDEIKDLQERDKDLVGRDKLELLRTYFVKCLIGFEFLGLMMLRYPRDRQEMSAAAKTYRNSHCIFQEILSKVLHFIGDRNTDTQIQFC